MNNVHKNAIVEYTAALCMKFSINPNTNTILYHHWFNLSSGQRNNGTGGNKSCPGSNFFEGNKVADCDNNFLPLVRNITGADEQIVVDDFDKLVCVTANRLNVRKGAGTNNGLARGIQSVKFGSVLKSFKEENGWYKINASAEHWISGKYTRDVLKGEVKANVLNVRSGAGRENEVVDQFHKGQDVIIELEQNGWYKLNLEEKWLSKDYVVLV